MTAMRPKRHAIRCSLRNSAFAVALVPLLALTATAQTSAGYPGLSPEPSAASKLTNSVKSGFNKVTKALIPDAAPKNDPDPISLSVPAKPSAGFHVAVAHMAEQKNDMAKAESHYRQALKLAPNHVDALMGYAHMLDRQQKLVQAAELYRIAVHAYPDNATAHNDLGICYARQGKLEEAIQSLEQAIQLRPGQARYRNNIATILVQSKQLDAAFAHLSAVHPKPVAFYNLGFLLHEAGDEKGAARLFQEALSLDPSLTQASIWLAKLHQGETIAQSSKPRRSAEQARQPQSVAQRPAEPPVIVPPKGSAAPMPPTGMAVPAPRIAPPTRATPAPQLTPAPQMAVPNQSPTTQLAPLPSIKPLPPIHGNY